VQKPIDQGHVSHGSSRIVLSRSRPRSSFLALPLALVLLAANTGCGPKEGPPPNLGGTDGAGNQSQTGQGTQSGGAQGAGTGGTAQAGGGPAGDPFEVKRPLREARLPTIDEGAVEPSAPKLPAAPKGLAPAPKTCGDFVKRKPDRAPACEDAAAGLAAIDAALSAPDAAKRDARLAGLEACPGLPVGLVRSIRAELAPSECADVIVEPVLKSPPANIKKPAYYAMLGQALAARLARTATSPPTMTPPFERKRVVEFLKGPMLAWMTEQTRLIEEIAKVGTGLPFYAKGVVAVEAGVADLRVVDVVRGAPVPKDIGDDEELRNVYFSSLDQQLDPRKDRGRDGALVGLHDLAIVGILKSERVDKARTLLSKLYGGRRIDALDGLLLPPLPALATSSVEERLAAKLPTFAAGFMLDPKGATKPATLRAFLDRGVPVQARAALADPSLSADLRALTARAHMELGRLYWRASDFDQVIALLTKGKGAAASPLPPEVSLLLATSIALSDGPEDAAEMMRKAPAAGAGGAQVGALDSIAKARGTYAGMAAYNGALILQIKAPQEAKAAYWKDVAERFQSAASMLPEGPARASASEHAKAALSVASAVK
jgi:hypothetical protein